VRKFLRLTQGTHLAQVAELVDALVSGTSEAIRGGSSPLLGTICRNPYKYKHLSAGNCASLVHISGTDWQW
jgi:hypothetical protein